MWWKFFSREKKGNKIFLMTKRLEVSTVIARNRSLADYKIERWKKKMWTNTELTMLSNRISNYSYINQGKTRIPGVNDGLEMDATDVSPAPRVSLSLGKIQTPLASYEII